MSAGDRDTLTGRMRNHDPAELNAIAALVTEGSGPDRRPLFSVRYGIAVAILESDWLREQRAETWKAGHGWCDDGDLGCDHEPFTPNPYLED